MSQVIALVPARSGSKGIPGKNFRRLGDKQLYVHALDCALAAGCDRIVLSTDLHEGDLFLPAGVEWLMAFAPLHTDTCAMIDVVKDALARVPGEPDDIWVLLQPTQPLRTPEHVKAAIARLRESNPPADSVVSLTELPKTHGPEYACQVNPWKGVRTWSGERLSMQPRNRQQAATAYRRDGTVYAFYRKTVEQFGTIYGDRTACILIPPKETCELDTMEQWEDLERRWKAREATVS